MIVFSSLSFHTRKASPGREALFVSDALAEPIFFMLFDLAGGKAELR